MSEEAWQRTLAREVALSGVGLHTGENTRLAFKPAPPDSGYVIVRADLPGRPRIHPAPDKVTQTRRGTTLSEGGVEAHTVEHVLAALAGMGVDNCEIELTGSEPPIMDGSAHLYVTALQNAGIVFQEGHPCRFVRVSGPVEVAAPGKHIVGWPGPGLRITYALDFDHPWVKPDRLTLDITPEIFASLIAPCRTFCFEEEITWLQQQGLARGGTLDNAIVITPAGPKQGNLRSPQELVLHKILDFIGDLALVGRPVKGHFTAVKSGHELNARLARNLRARADREERAQRGTHTMPIDIREILQYLPHRYPFLLVDRVIDIEEGKRVVGIKNVTINEPFFQGHFPDHPIMPGVLIVEAMAQVGGVLLMRTVENPEGKVVYFMALDKVRFRKPVFPGDQIRFELVATKFKGKVAKMTGTAYVGEDVVCEAELMSMLVDR